MSTAPLPDKAQIDTITQEFISRFRSRLLKSVRLKEFEEILDANFRLNDEDCTTLQQAWICAMRLDCQLGEADRLQEDRNRWLQTMAAERTEIMQVKVDLESSLLSTKLEVQMAMAGGELLHVDKLADVLQANLDLRSRVAKLGQELEDVVCSAQWQLRSLGERPDACLSSGADPKANLNAKRWREEFDAVRNGNDALLQALSHPDAAVAVPACALEERYDHNWRFELELVGLLEKVLAQHEDEKGTKAENGDSAGSTAKESDEDELSKEANQHLAELELQLPALLESKLYTQEAAAKFEAQDTDRAEKHIKAATKCQVAIWKFLTKHKVDLASIVPTKFAEEMLPHPGAFGFARSTGDGLLENVEYPTVLRLLTYNLFLHPPAPKKLHNNEDDRKDERLSRFLTHLPNYDLVLLQETFGAFSQRRDQLIDAATHIGFHHIARSQMARPLFLIDAGLLIMSRLPMVERASLTFSPGTQSDRLYAKGALYVKLQCGPSGPWLHVVTTQLQPTTDEDTSHQAAEVRHSQMGELIEFIREQTGRDEVCEGHHRRRWPLLVAGDFNCNARRSAMDGSSSSNEYCELMNQLRQGLNSEVRDLLFDVCGSHPVTYADTRLARKGEVPVERVLTAPSAYESALSKRQRLDYLLLFPMPEEIDGKHHTTGREPLVPATCRVEKFQVDRARDVGAPITQLSTHYGIEATMAVIRDADDTKATCPAPLVEHSAPPHLQSNGSEVCSKECDGEESFSEDDPTDSQCEDAYYLDGAADLPADWASDERAGVDPAFWAAADAFARGCSPDDNGDLIAAGGYSRGADMMSDFPQFSLATDQDDAEHQPEQTTFVRLTR